MNTQATNSKFGNVMRVSSGNFLEMYDFMVYAYYASYIAHEIFPSSSAYASLMMTLGTFRRGLPDAAARRRCSRRVRGPARQAHRAHPHFIFDGDRDAGDRLHACVQDDRDRRSHRGAAWAAVAGIFGGSRSGRRVHLPFRDGDARASRILLRLAIGEPAGGGDFRGASGSGAERCRAARGDGPVGLARSVLHRMPDCAAAVLVAQIAGGDGSVSRAKASSRDFGNPRLARIQLENRRHRRVAFHHDDGEFLSDHRVHADLRH